MLRIQRAILLEIAGTFVVTSCLVTAVMFGGQSLQRMGRTQGLEMKHLLAMLPSFLPLALSYALPYSYLPAVALTYGRMVADREVVALWIAGAHARTRAVRMQERAIFDLFLASLGNSDRSNAFEGGRMSFGGHDPSTGAFLGFEFDRRGKGGHLPQEIIGDRAILRRVGDPMTLEADNAFVIGEEQGHGTRATPTHGMTGVAVGLVVGPAASTEFDDFVGSGPFEKKSRYMDLPERMYTVERGGTIGIEPRRSRPEMHARVASAFAPFASGMVAAAVAPRTTPRGRRLTGFLLAVLSVLCVHRPLFLGGRSLAESGRVPPFVGIWTADVILVLAGIWCLRRVYAR